MRAFVAIDVSSDAIAKLQKDILSEAGWNLRDVKPVEPHNLHLTLIFLGEISHNDSDKIKERLTGFQFEPFTVSYSGIGAFPNPARARVVWIGVDSEGVQKLTTLANDVVSKVSEIGFKADKPFSAHITILRAKGRPIRAAQICSKYHGRTFGSDIIEKIHLKQSELTASGPLYSNVYTVQAKK